MKEEQNKEPILKVKHGDLATVFINKIPYFREITPEDWDQLSKDIDEYNKLLIHFEEVKEESFLRELDRLETDILHNIDPLVKAELLKKELQSLENKLREEEKYFKEKTRKRKSSKLLDSSGLFEIDSDNFCYLRGFNEPLPAVLINALLDAKFNPSSNFKYDSLINFWKWLMINPDKHVRNDLFRWLKTSKFSITNDGMIISYRNVNLKDKSKTSKVNNEYVDFITSHYIKAKRNKRSPHNYTVCLTSDNKYIIHYEKNKISLKEFCKIKDAKKVNTLHNLYEKVVNNSTDKKSKVNESNSEVIFTDNYTRSMEIKIGVPVKMKREECDNDPNAACSKGLHQKSTQYSLNLGDNILVCLVNPYNVVAIPNYDSTKFRCCEYLPISKAPLDKFGNIEEVLDGTYDFDYAGYSTKTLEDLINNYQDRSINSAIDVNQLDSILEDMKNIISSRRATV
jgi:hypothetical protein